MKEFADGIVGARGRVLSLPTQKIFEEHIYSVRLHKEDDEDWNV